MPANYESIRTRHLHAKIGGENKGRDSWAYTTQFYFPEPYDNDIDGDGTPDKVIEGGVPTDLDAIALRNDPITAGDVASVGAEFSDLVGNILTVSNNPLVDGYFDTTLNIVMPRVFQTPLIGDYNGDGVLNIEDLRRLTSEIQSGANATQFDLDQSGTVDLADRQYWVTDIKSTWIGDANLDGRFDSSDFIEVFQSGKYESGDSADWSEGDWNGDQLFDSGDFIVAFQDGGYEIGPRTAVASVPEPSAWVLLTLVLVGLVRSRRTTCID